MSYVKKFKQQEKEFADIIKKFGDIKFSDTEQDINEHWDVKLETKFDIKAIRKINRSDIKTNENIHWVELKNVNGDVGWLYGKADYFSFELEEYWLIVEKSMLQKLISEKCQKKLVTSPKLYELYNRKGRKDVITLVKTIDLCYISECIIKK